MVANNGAVAVEQSGNSIVVKGKLADLVEFPSSVAAQGTHKWIGLDIATNLETIEGATWNGYTENGKLIHVCDKLQKDFEYDLSDEYAYIELK